GRIRGISFGNLGFVPEERERRRRRAVATAFARRRLALSVDEQSAVVFRWRRHRRHGYCDADGAGVQPADAVGRDTSQRCRWCAVSGWPLAGVCLERERTLG